MCPQNSNFIDDIVRNLFWNDHNFYRSVVARNAPVGGEKVVQRPASQMNQIRNYGCALEYAAYLTASRCSATDDSASSPANNENQYIARNLNAAPLDAAKQAINSWFGEIQSNKMPQGPGQKNLYTSSLGIPHGAMFIWETHTTIGCAIAKCSTFFKVVCYYSPELANMENRQIYKMGPTCARCKVCNDGLCNP
ncbi:hypothetical protein Aduo_004339 [Ancylostoma duodenale]